MTEPADKLLSEFIDDWNAGRRPRVDAFLARASPGARDALAERLADWLAIAPTPELGAGAREAIRAEPAFRRALAQLDSEPTALPELLPRLRERAGLGVRDLAARITAAFGLAGGEARAADYLDRIERGELATAALSRRLLDALGSILGADLVRAGGPGPAAPAGEALFRATPGAAVSFEEELDALSRAALSPAPEPMDELDRLFRGGPDA